MRTSAKHKGLCEVKAYISVLYTGRRIRHVLWKHIIGICPLVKMPFSNLAKHRLATECIILHKSAGWQWFYCKACTVPKGEVFKVKWEGHSSQNQIKSSIGCRLYISKFSKFLFYSRIQLARYQVKIFQIRADHHKISQVTAKKVQRVL